MNIREPLSARQRKDAMQKAAEELPTADGAAAKVQLAAVRSMIHGINTRQACMQQAVAASQGKDWSPEMVHGLAEGFFKFLSAADEIAKPE